MISEKSTSDRRFYNVTEQIQKCKLPLNKRIICMQTNINKHILLSCYSGMQTYKLRVSSMIKGCIECESFSVARSMIAAHTYHDVHLHQRGCSEGQSCKHHAGGHFPQRPEGRESWCPSYFFFTILKLRLYQFINQKSDCHTSVDQLFFIYLFFTAVCCKSVSNQPRPHLCLLK